MDNADMVNETARDLNIDTNNHYSGVTNESALKSKPIEDLIKRWKSLENKVVDERQKLETYIKTKSAELDLMDDEIALHKHEIGRRLGFVKEQHNVLVNNVQNNGVKHTRVSNRREQIIEVVKNYGPLTRGEICNHLGVPYHTLQTSISNAIKRGFLSVDAANRMIDIA